MWIHNEVLPGRTERARSVSEGHGTAGRFARSPGTPGTVSTADRREMIIVSKYQSE